ncbi:T9SS type A sorting domain-containing protein, partial [candidate division KSB1 bacterium]|nr:T9SS type A sorting domain-containing protein [candidate division KSB1 bacterium]
IPSLDPGQSATLTWNGTASVGQYTNVGTASTTYDGQTVEESDLSHYLGTMRPEPSLDIEKATNGQDADDPTGPEIMAGDPVTWTYVVTNTGNVTLTNIVVTDDIEGEIGTIPSLDPGQSATLTWNGTASVGQYANVGTASTTYDGQTVEESDPSHYLGTIRPEPSLDIEKATNGQDADDPTGPNITEGDVVTWTYVVTNTGNVTLTSIVVTDDKIGDVGTIPSLDPGQSHTLTKTGTATLGQYGNVGTATTTHEDQTIQDSDPSHYFGIQKATPSLDIEKATNGEDADAPKGPEIMEGDKVTWTYVVTNTGNVTLTNIVVTDDVLGQVGTISSLDPGNSQTITIEDVAAAGQYKNTATAAADYDGQRVEDSDPSHYFGVRVKIDIEKSTNGVDADLPPGVYLYVGDDVEWKYVVTNTGNVPLKNIVVTDDQLGPICTIEYLGVGEQSICTANGYAQEGPYKNVGTVCGYYDEYKTCDSDPSHYTGSEKPMPSIDIEKATNGEDADVAPGPLVTEGSTVTWTYVVTNTGNVPLTNVVVKDDKEGEICTIAVLEVGESKECTKTGVAGVGQYENIGSACGWYEEEKVKDDDPSHYVGEQFTPTEPDDFAVCISFKDKDGNYVGDVLAVLSIPGEKDWKVLSTWEEQLAAGRYPCNCHFRRLAYNVGGTYKFKFYAPDGWKFISPDHMEIEMQEGESYYGISGNLFYLERTTRTTSATTTPDTPQAPMNADPNSLIFVKGSPTASGEGWDNLVDGDIEGWDGTTTAQRDMKENTPPYAIFRFADAKVYQFSHLKIQTDNGKEDDEWSFRQATKIDVQVSTRGLTDDDFVSIGVLDIKRGDMRLYKLRQMAKAKYVKLVILQPNWTPNGWAQLVEFILDSPLKQGPELASDDIEFSALPEVFNLHQNYPNPFNPLTTVQYDLPTDSHVTLTIYDVTGRQVTTLVDEFQNAGFYSVLWDAAAYPSGLYFYQIQADEYKALRKMTLIK